VWGLLSATVILLAALPSAAQSPSADPLAEAQALYDSAALPDALAAFEAALRAGGHRPQALARIHWHLGVLRAMTGATEEAETSFALALALDPDASVPRELAPEDQALFRRLESQARAMELSISTETVAADAPTPLGAEVRHARAGWVHTLRLAATPPRGSPWRLTAAPGDPLSVPPAAWRGSDTLAVEIVALDVYDNVLAVGTTTLRLAPTAGAATPIGDEPARRSVARSPWLWVAIAVVVGGVLTAVLATTMRQNVYESGPPIVER
jgi:hypothetical protein